ncbi:MAG: hypothetical protein JXQ75_00675 [Phycisphaerae bacterium]|nr:hypothetical protein [Phycisphaerae bacterium]
MWLSVALIALAWTTQSVAVPHPWDGKVVWELLLASGFDGPPGKQPVGGEFLDDEPDDRLSVEDERLTHELTERGMPELVEELLAGHPPAHGIYVARAYARAAVDEPDTVVRERFFDTASWKYREMISLEDRPDWLRGLRRRFHIVQWRVELADLILRYRIASDLDRFEITSGLDYNRRRLTEMLREAHQLYRAAEHELDELLVGLRTEEERYLLLGLGKKITALYERRRLNEAWAAVYLALAGEVEDAERQYLLETALSAFDAVARTAKDSSRKYNALLGAGIALREGARYAEAGAAFDRVWDSTAPVALAARARYEKARLLIRARHFDAARQELEDLAAISTKQLGDEDSGAVFYIRLAPLIHAYSYALEAGSTRGGPSFKENLRKEAISALTSISEQGGIWPEVVRVYLDVLAGGKRKLDELAPTELHVTASRLMAEKDYAEAIKALRMLLDRPDGKEWHVEARFNLGVCHFQRQERLAAAEAFLAVARQVCREGTQVPTSGVGVSSDFAERACEYAYRCWRQVAHTSQEADHYLRLAEASELLVRAFPEHELAAEAGWVAALARQEAGDCEAALAAYAEVPPSSPHYWEARRNIARCKQRLCESLPASASPARRSRTAQSAASAWIKLAEDLAAVADVGRSSGESGGAAIPGVGSGSDRDEWVKDARLSAAAILASDDARSYEASLAILADMEATGRVVAMRIRCYRGLGDLETARRALNEYLKQSSGPEIGEALIGLAAEMESEIIRLRNAGRRREAIRMAESSVPTFRQLLEWIQAQPGHRNHVPVVRFSLAKALVQAGHDDEAMALLEQLIRGDPSNGSYVRAAALLQEDVAMKAGTSERRTALDKAEALWAGLLEDPTLRDRRPAEYWEARYYWLKHQLRRGHAADVMKAIETERAWFRDLGGPPWQARLLELAEEARAAAERGQPEDAP